MENVFYFWTIQHLKGPTDQVPTIAVSLDINT